MICLHSYYFENSLLIQNFFLKYTYNFNLTFYVSTHIYSILSTTKNQRMFLNHFASSWWSPIKAKLLFVFGGGHEVNGQHNSPQINAFLFLSVNQEHIN